jgi:GxxExxY protein
METHGDLPLTSVDGETNARLVHGRLTNQVLGAAFATHSALGGGFLESVYANALTVELRARGLRVARNVPFDLFHRGTRVGRYVADLIVEGLVVVETKAVRSIEAPHRAQLLNYLRASGLEVGIVLNFGTSMQFKRIIATPRGPNASTLRERSASNENNIANKTG